MKAPKKWIDATTVGPQAEPVATHHYSKPGTYEVTVTVSESSQQAPSTAMASITVAASQPPRVLLTQPSMVMPGQSFTVDASSTTAPNGKIVTYQFNLWEGTTISELTSQSTPVAVFAIDHPCDCAILVVATDDHGYSGMGGLDVEVGIRFSRTHVPSEAPDLWRGGTALARDSEGNLDMVWYDAGNFAFGRSTNGGASFGSQVMLATQIPQWFVEVGFGWDIAVSQKGTILAAWTWNSVQGDARIELVRSVDNGTTFAPVSTTNTTTPLPFFDEEGTSNAAPKFAIIGDTVVLTWFQDATPAQPPTVTRFAISTDEGATWQVQSQSGTPNPEPTGTAMAVQNNSLFVTSVVNNQLLVSRSDDFGKTFATPVVVDSEANISGPMLYAGGRRLALTWIVGEIDPRVLKLSISDDNGQTWSQASLPAMPADIAQCGCGAVDAAGNIYVAYSSGQANGLANYFHRLVVTPDGQNFGPRYLLPIVYPQADCVQISPNSPGTIDLYWSEYSQATSAFDVYFASGQILVPN